MSENKENKQQKSVVRTTYLQKNGAVITVHSLGSFHEIQIAEPENNNTRHLDVIMRDTSGSMFNVVDQDGKNVGFDHPDQLRIGAIGVLNNQLQKLVDRAIADDHDVAIISWAQDAAYEMVDAKNQATVLKDTCDMKASMQRQANQAKVPLKKNDFAHPEWWGATYPRRGFERLTEILAERKEKPGSITVWFGTDGAFSKATSAYDKKMCDLSDEYLQSLQRFLVDYNVPVKMVYVGVYQDRAADAERIMKVFPVCKYMYARDVAGLPSLDMISEMQTQVVYDRVMTTQDGAKTVVIVENQAHVMCQKLEFPDAKLQRTEQIDLPYIEIRAAIYEQIARLKALEAKRATGAKIYDELMVVDRALKGFEQQIAKIRVGKASERQATREYLFVALRVKNLLQQYAAQEVSKDATGDGGRKLLAQNQELKMAQGDKFSIAIAKRITQNKANRRPWESAVEIVDAKDGKDYVTTVKFTDNNQTVTYKTEGVPARIATDEAIDFLSCDSWAEVYAAGSCKAQCIKFVEAPSEIVFHAPSRARVQLSNSQVSLNTVLDSIEQRVAVEGFDSLFKRPFTGAARDEYTAGLPTWSPNLNFVSRYRLRSLIGYLLGGHDLATPSRWVDIYIPAIVNGWNQFFETKSAVALENVMMLQLAFINIKQWTKAGNMYDQKAVTPTDSLKLWAGGNEGTHAFMNMWEPMLYALMVPGEVTPADLQRRFTAQIVYHGAKAADTLWADVLKPLAREVIAKLELLEKKDFDPKAKFVDEKQGLPITPAMQKIADDYLDKRCRLALGFLKNMMRMHTLFLKTPDIWAQMQASYQLPAGVAENARIALASDVKDMSTADIIGMIAIANDYPSNATRREMKHTGAEVFDQKCRVVFLEEAGEMRKNKYYEGRLAECHTTHAGFPIILTYDDTLIFQRAHKHDAKKFEADFRKQFAAHIELERSLVTDQKTFDTMLSNSLAAFHAQADGTAIDISVTNLPKNRCGCILCPQFMQYNRQLDAHFAIFGTDLRNGHACRLWVPNMHIQMSKCRGMNLKTFVEAMMRYTAQYIDKSNLARFEKYFTWVHARM